MYLYVFKNENYVNEIFKLALQCVLIFYTFTLNEFQTLRNSGQNFGERR